MVSRMMQWRNRLVEKGLDEEIADELVVGLPEQFASADDVRKIDRRLARVEQEIAALRLDVGRIDERLTAVERGLVELRAELRAMREELRAMRDEFARQLEAERAERRAQTRMLVTVMVVLFGANAGLTGGLMAIVLRGG